MHMFILDQYAHQPLLKRILWNSLTGFGWAFWIYLWLPLLIAINLLIGPHPEQATSAASQSILALLATLTGHASVLGIMIAAFVAWSLLQWLSKSYRHEALQKRLVNVLCQASLTAHAVQNLPLCQKEQCMVVSHNDASGFIQYVEIIKPNPSLTLL